MDVMNMTSAACIVNFILHAKIFAFIVISDVSKTEKPFRIV